MATETAALMEDSLTETRALVTDLKAETRALVADLTPETRDLVADLTPETRALLADLAAATRDSEDLKDCDSASQAVVSAVLLIMFSSPVMFRRFLQDRARLQE